MDSAGGLTVCSPIKWNGGYSARGLRRPYKSLQNAPLCGHSASLSRASRREAVLGVAGRSFRATEFSAKIGQRTVAPSAVCSPFLRFPTPYFLQPELEASGRKIFAGTGGAPRNKCLFVGPSKRGNWGERGGGLRSPCESPQRCPVCCQLASPSHTSRRTAVPAHMGRNFRATRFLRISLDWASEQSLPPRRSRYSCNSQFAFSPNLS